jgi:hypothetical protein
MDGCGRGKNLKRIGIDDWRNIIHDEVKRSGVKL